MVGSGKRNIAIGVALALSLNSIGAGSANAQTSKLSSLVSAAKSSVQQVASTAKKVAASATTATVAKVSAATTSAKATTAKVATAAKADVAKAVSTTQGAVKAVNTAAAPVVNKVASTTSAAISTAKAGVAKSVATTQSVTNATIVRITPVAQKVASTSSSALTATKTDVARAVATTQSMAASAKAVVAPLASGAINSIPQQFHQGIDQIKQGSGEIARGEGLVAGAESGLRIESGITTAAFSPLAPASYPVAKVVGAVTNPIVEKVSDIPRVQRFAASRPGQATARVAEDVSNTDNIAGAIVGIRMLRTSPAAPALGERMPVGSVVRDAATSEARPTGRLDSGTLARSREAYDATRSPMTNSAPGSTPMGRGLSQATAEAPSSAFGRRSARAELNASDLANTATSPARRSASKIVATETQQAGYRTPRTGWQSLPEVQPSTGRLDSAALARARESYSAARSSVADATPSHLSAASALDDATGAASRRTFGRGTTPPEYARGGKAGRDLTRRNLPTANTSEAQQPRFRSALEGWRRLQGEQPAAYSEPAGASPRPNAGYARRSALASYPQTSGTAATERGTIPVGRDLSRVPAQPYANGGESAAVRSAQFSRRVANDNLTAPPLTKEGIYEFPDQVANGRPYVGQSGNIPDRLAQHAAAGRLTQGTEAVTEVIGGKTPREIAEHSRIQEITGGQKAGTSPSVSNQRDPVGPNRRAKFGIPEPNE